MDFKIDKPRRRRKRNSAITFILFTSTIFAFLICVLLLFSYAGQRKKAQQAMAEVEILTEENSKMFTQSQVNSFVEKAKQEFLDKLKSMVENGEGMLTILQRFYPDYVIASSNGGYHFFPISDKLEKNNFDLEKFTYPVYNEESKEWEGTATYMEGTEKEAKKGVDVSTFQGDIDWKKVKKSGMEFAIIRLGFRGYESGKIVLDSKFEDNIECLKLLSKGNWCTKDGFIAQSYLEKGDFHIFLKDGAPKVAIRFSGVDIQEIQGEKNNMILPEEYNIEVKKHLKEGEYFLNDDIGFLIDIIDRGI